MVKKKEQNDLMITVKSKFMLVINLNILLKNWAK